MLQYCSFDIYGPINHIGMIMYFLTMGGTLVLFLFSWFGHLWQEQKLQLELPGFEGSTKRIADQLEEGAWAWFMGGVIGLTFMSAAWFIHALSCLMKG